jgi:DNA-binding beta-propeller fold protein YncE
LFASLRYLPARRVVPALAVPLAAIALLADAQAAPARLFVSAEDGNEVVVLEADQVVGRIPVGKRPRGVRLSRDGRSLFVALSGSPKVPPGGDEANLPPADRSADGIGLVDVASDPGRLLRVLTSGPDPEAFD